MSEVICLGVIPRAGRMEWVAGELYPCTGEIWGEVPLSVRENMRSGSGSFRGNEESSGLSMKLNSTRSSPSARVKTAFENNEYTEKYEK
ncbi:MAG: hypothetical protein WC379_12450 [Methanoregula sp.]|jgi:hypothetical protein